MTEMRKHYIYTFLIIIFSGCGAPMKMNVKGNTEIKLSPLKNNQTVVVIEENENLPNSKSNIKIGEFSVKTGLSIDCSYDRVKEIAKQKARNVGGNTIKLTEHKLPNAWNLCHRIEFEVYKLDDVSEFQKELIWSETEQLKWEYFKASPRFDRMSYFCAYIKAQFNDQNVLNGKGNIYVAPIFMFDCSYVQPLEKNKFLLEYNQLKFDLLEIYSRKLRKEYSTSGIDTYEKWEKFWESIYDKVLNDLKTDLYNVELETNFGENRSGLVSWKFKVENDLKKLTEYSSEK